MKRIVVKFDNYHKEYTYVTNLNFVVGRKYKIASGSKNYTTPITVISIQNAKDSDKWQYLEITERLEMPGNPRKESPIKSVLFNEAKGYTTVIWVDGLKTILKCDSREAYFDKEKAIGLAFMKRCFENSSYFNDELKKWCGENYDPARKNKDENKVEAEPEWHCAG